MSTVSEFKEIKYTLTQSTHQKEEKVVEKTQEPIFFCTKSSTEKKILQTLSKLTKDWDEIASNRFAETRVLRNQNRTEQTQYQFLEDQTKLSQYKLPTSMFREDVQRCIGKNTKENISFIILEDINRQPQAFASIYIRTNEIFINTLFTAPWNFEMHGQIENGHKPLVTKGAGCSILRSICEIAQSQKIPVTLKPTQGSLGFYKKMGMDFIQKTEKEMYFQYDLKNSTIPKQLKDRTEGIVKFV